MWSERRLLSSDTPWFIGVCIVPSTRCDEYDSLRQVEADPHRLDIGPVPRLSVSGKEGHVMEHQPSSRCPYTVGVGLFHALEEYLCADVFAERAAELARELVRHKKEGIYSRVDFRDLRRIFQVENDEGAREILNLWYGGFPQEDQGLYPLTDSVDWNPPPSQTQAICCLRARPRQVVFLLTTTWTIAHSSSCWTLWTSGCTLSLADPRRVVFTGSP